jgi:hypothetical protein
MDGLGPEAEWSNGTARFKKCKQLFEYRHLLLLSSFFQHQNQLDICGGLRLLFSCIRD